MELLISQNIKPYTSYRLRAELEILQKKTICTNFDRLSLILDQLSQTELHTQFKLRLKQTLSKSKPRLTILIMVCQHIQNEVLIYLVPKVLEPNTSCKS